MHCHPRLASPRLASPRRASRCRASPRRAVPSHVLSCRVALCHTHCGATLAVPAGVDTYPHSHWLGSRGAGLGSTRRGAWRGVALPRVASRCLALPRVASRCLALPRVALRSAMLRADCFPDGGGCLTAAKADQPRAPSAWSAAVAATPVVRLPPVRTVAGMQTLSIWT